jgi:acyl-CoA synthetase (AMP-forming)/AMP-acid ligase II
VFKNGWFRTGDVAYLDNEGYLFIVDRIKDLIIRGGENIGCGQVEAALLKHPDVHEAAVYAVPDERLGEEVGATVYGSAALDVDGLRDFLKTHLARFEVRATSVPATAATAGNLKATRRKLPRCRQAGRSTRNPEDEQKCAATPAMKAEGVDILFAYRESAHRGIC